eukprot:TRINITY_DN3401_c0_g1_i1.p1 TRINITY_DN3401_c0_g1~~TRINITY_DN3401_c0_g1_i1.p1  ORF type:complete len:338 (-),score=56.96 TRINITY_DN3401_c0_g1_i1:60-1073(-)
MSATRRPVSRLKRFVRRVALGSIVTVATAAVTAPAWAPQLVTPLAERFFRSKQLDGTVGAIEIAWPRITVRGIAIGNPRQGHTYVDERFLQVDRADLSFSGPLSDLSLVSVRIDGVKLHIERRGLRTFNFDEVIALLLDEDTQQVAKPPPAAPPPQPGDSDSQCDISVYHTTASFRLTPRVGKVSAPPVKIVVPHFVVPTDVSLTSAPVVMVRVINALLVATLATAATHVGDVADLATDAARVGAKLGVSTTLFVADGAIKTARTANESLVRSFNTVVAGRAIFVNTLVGNPILGLHASAMLADAFRRYKGDLVDRLDDNANDESEEKLIESFNMYE